MGMLDFFISVKIDNGYVAVTGINTKVLSKKIKDIQGDSRFSNGVLEPIFRGYKFKEFFLPDFYYIVKKIHDSNISKSYKSTLSSLLNELKEKTWLKDLESNNRKELNFDRLKELTYTPIDYQLNFFKYYDTTVHKLKLKGTLLAAATGSGKSYVSLALATLLEAERIIVVCQLNSVNQVWEAQINEVFYNPPTYYLSNSNKSFNNEKICVYHFEALQKAINDVNKFPTKGKTVIILDESHNFNEIKSLRSQLFLELCKITNSNDIIFQSGTAVKAMGSELVVLFKAIDPLFTDDVKTIFTRLYGSKTSSNNLDLLNSRLGLISFKVDKKETGLTEPITIQVPIKSKNGDKYTLENVSLEMSKYISERTVYYAKRNSEDVRLFNKCISIIDGKLNNTDKIRLHEYIENIEIIKYNYKNKSLTLVKDNIISANKFENEVIIPNLPPEYKNIFKDIKTLIKYPSLKIQGEALGRILTRMRIDCFIELSNLIDYETIIDESEKKTLIFSSNIEVCENTIKRLKELKYNPLGVYGEYTKNLSKIVEQFKTDPEINPLVTTYDSLSTAVPLIVANTIIMINLPFRSYIKEQAIARIHRLKQDTQTYIYEVSLDTDNKPNLSTRTIDILEWSKKQVQSIMGDDIGLDWNEISENSSLDNTSITISNESYDIKINSCYVNDKTSLIENW